MNDEVCVIDDSLPLDAILVPLLYEADALEDVGDVVDPALLLHLQQVRGLKSEHIKLLGSVRLLE